MGAELVEVLLGHIETLLGTSHVSLVVGCEELIVSLFFDVWAGRSRASHFGSSLKMYSMDFGCRQSMKAVDIYLWVLLIVRNCERLYCGLDISYCYGFKRAIRGKSKQEEIRIPSSQLYDTHVINPTETTQLYFVDILEP
jgi:hypothetical protein